MEYLYIINETDSTNYKIGRSYQVENRIKSLQTSNANKLILIDKYQCKTCSVLEKRIHNNLKDKKLNGEWFTLSSDELNNVIELICKSIIEIHKKLNKNVCEICKFSTYKNENFEKHIKSESHKQKLRLQKINREINEEINKEINNKTITNINSRNGKFICDICNHSARDKSDYNKHLLTKKHIEKVNETPNHTYNIPITYQNESLNNEEKCQFCDKKYANSSGLARHKKTCDKRLELSNKIDELYKIINQKDEILKQKDETLKQKDETLKQKDETISVLKAENSYLKTLK